MPFKVIITAILILFIQGNRIVVGSTQKPFKRSLASRGLMSLYLTRLLKPKSGRRLGSKHDHAPEHKLYYFPPCLVVTVLTS